MIIPSCEIHIRRMIWFHFVLILWWSLFLSHLVRLILPDVVVIFWIELFRVHWFPHHHFSGVHVRSFIHPRGVILELSGQTGYIWCHTRAYFPPPVVEVMIFSQICYSLQRSVERYFIFFTGHCSCDYRWDEPSARHDLRVLTVSLCMIL